MARKVCEICSTRPVGSGKGDQDATGAFCNPCYTESGWENTHNDHGHDGILEKLANKKRLTANQKAEQDHMTDCWICHEELNEAKKAYTVRQGTSRAGIVIHVSIRAAGETKAAETQAQLEQISEAYSFKIATAKKSGEVTLRVESGQQNFILFWDARGRFIGGSVAENGKTRKVRNVAEVLRIAS
jgi:hypothetical protein